MTYFSNIGWTFRAKEQNEIFKRSVRKTQTKMGTRKKPRSVIGVANAVGVRRKKTITLAKIDFK